MRIFFMTSASPPRVLLVTGRYPWPPLRGDQLRTTQMLRLLARRHRVTLLCPDPSERDRRESAVPENVEVLHYRRGRSDLGTGTLGALLGSRPLQTAPYHAADLQRRLKEAAPQHDLVVLQLARIAEAREVIGDVPFVADLIDSLALNFTTRAECDRQWLRPFWRLEARRLARLEEELVRESVQSWVVCDRDRRSVLERTPSLSPESLQVVPLVVEPERSEPGPGDGSGTLVLTGNFGYFVNRDALDWTLRELWPRLDRRRYRWLVAGSRLSTRCIERLRSAGVEVIDSPPRLGPILDRAGVALAPTRCGSGVPLKVLEAWARGVCVVAAPFAAAGTDATPGQELEVATEPSQWVTTIDRLLEDPDGRRQRIEAASGLLRRRHSEDAVASRLTELLALIS